MYERIDRAYIEQVLTVSDAVTDICFREVDDFELFEIVRNNFTYHDLKITWQNFVLQYKPSKTACEIQSDIIKGI